MMNSEVDIDFIFIQFHIGKRCAAVHQVDNQVNCLCEPVPTSGLEASLLEYKRAVLGDHRNRISC